MIDCLSVQLLVPQVFLVSHGQRGPPCVTHEHRLSSVPKGPIILALGAFQGFRGLLPRSQGQRPDLSGKARLFTLCRSPYTVVPLFSLFAPHCLSSGRAGLPNGVRPPGMKSQLCRVPALRPSAQLQTTLSLGFLIRETVGMRGSLSEFRGLKVMIRKRVEEPRLPHNKRSLMQT